MISRRVFLKNGSFALVSLGFAPSFLARTAFAAGAARRSKQLIAIFQRGAVDGLNMVVPFGEADYYRARPSIAIAPAGRRRRCGASISTASSASTRVSRRSSRSGIGAISRSCTRADRPTPRARTSTRRTTWKRATPGVKSTGDGWLNRYLQARRRGGEPLVSRRRADPAAAAHAAGRRAGAGDESDRAVRHPRRPTSNDVVRGAVRRRPPIGC